MAQEYTWPLVYCDHKEFEYKSECSQLDVLYYNVETNKKDEVNSLINCLNIIQCRFGVSQIIFIEHYCVKSSITNALLTLPSSNFIFKNYL